MIPAWVALCGCLLGTFQVETTSPRSDPAEPFSSLSAEPDPTFLPEAVFDLPGGPRVTFLRTGSRDLVALRVSLPLEEAPDEAGAGSLIRTMAEERMEALAARIGARARVTRTARALVYEAAGSAADLDFLVWILGEGMQAPDPARFEAVRRAALANVARRMETPQGVLALQLREALAPGTPPLLGTLPALERLDPSRLAAVWARSHRRDAARVLVVGALPSETVLASLTDLSLPHSGPDPALPPQAQPAEPRLRPEVIRHWSGSAWPVAEGHDPRALVAMRILSESLERRPGDYEAGVELWEVDGRWFLILSGAAYPRARQAMRSRLDGLLSEARDGITDEAVRRHAARTRAELLESARTPWGLAEIVGQVLDAERDPAELERMLARLVDMDAADLRAFFEALGAGTPVRREVGP